MFAIGARVYMKPLHPGERFHLDVIKLMEQSKRALLRRLRGNLLQQQVFSPAAKRALNKAIQVKVKSSSLQITSEHPAFLPLLKGQKSEQMTWLTKARAPIPIILDSGKLIFRNATPASMARGAWWHPGRTPTDYLDKARHMTREYMRDKMMKEVQKNFELRMSRAGKKVMKSR